MYLIYVHRGPLCLRVCISVGMCHHGAVFSPSVHDIKAMTVDSVMKGLPRFTHIRLAIHLLHVIKYITLEDLQEALTFTQNCSPVVKLEKMSMTL